MSKLTDAVAKQCDAQGCLAPSAAIRNGHAFFWCRSNVSNSRNIALPDRERYHRAPNWMHATGMMRVRSTCELGRICVTCAMDPTRPTHALAGPNLDELRARMLQARPWHPCMHCLLMDGAGSSSVGEYQDRFGYPASGICRETRTPWYACSEPRLTMVNHG